MISRWSKVIADIFGTGKDREILHVPCPFHKDNRPSMRVNLKTDSYICFAYPDGNECGKGHIRNLVAKYYDISLMRADMLSPPLPLTEDSIILPEGYGFEKENRREKKIILLPEVELEYNRNILPRFILERGFTKKFLREWQCGTDEKSVGLMVPAEDEHRRIIGGIVRRPDGYQPKYMYTKNFPRNKSLFGLGKLLEHGNNNDIPYVIVVEGVLDALWLWQCGYPSLALLGGTLSIPQKILMTKLPTKEIVLCFDNDKVGKNVSDSVLNEMSKFFFISRMDIPSKYKDIQDVRNAKEIHQLVDDRLNVLLYA